MKLFQIIISGISERGRLIKHKRDQTSTVSKVTNGYHDRPLLDHPVISGILIYERKMFISLKNCTLKDPIPTNLHSRFKMFIELYQQ